MPERHISLDVARQQGAELADTLDILMPRPTDGEANLLLGLEIVTKVSVLTMVEKGWTERDAVVSLAAMVAQILVEGGPGGEALAIHLERLARQYGTAHVGETGTEADAFFTADGVNMLTAQQMAGTLDRLYPAIDAEASRLGATRHVIDLVLATMAARAVPVQDAVQTVLATVMEILIDGLGPAGAAAHLRRMAELIETNAPGASMH